MLRVVSENGERVGPGWGAGGKARRASSAAHAQPAATKLDLGMELSAAIFTTMVEAMLRCGMARPEQAEFVMSQVADRYDALVSDAPMHLRERPEWDDFERRCKRASADVREAAFEIVMGCAR